MLKNGCGKTANTPANTGIKMSFADRDGFIWMDGELVPWREAQVHVLTHTLHYGMGVFEGVRAYETDAVSYTHLTLPTKA